MSEPSKAAKDVAELIQFDKHGLEDVAERIQHVIDSAVAAKQKQCAEVARNHRDHRHLVTCGDSIAAAILALPGDPGT